jgi:hypothetical protein
MDSGSGPRTTQPDLRAVERLRHRLAPALAALDRAAADPWELDDRADELRAHQYSLHEASERVHRLELGAGFRELELALANAREETAELIELLEDHGAGAASALVWEWRVSPFAVRLALRELEQPAAEHPRPPRPQAGWIPVVVLTSGVATVLGGALASLWPVWLLGLVFVAVSTGLSHRFP